MSESNAKAKISMMRRAKLLRELSDLPVLCRTIPLQGQQDLRVYRDPNNEGTVILKLDDEGRYCVIDTTDILIEAMQNYLDKCKKDEEERSARWKSKPTK